MGTPAEHLRQQYMRLVAGMQAATAELNIPELPVARRALLTAHLERLQHAHRDFLTRYVSATGAPPPGASPAPSVPMATSSPAPASLLSPTGGASGVPVSVLSPAMAATARPPRTPALSPSAPNAPLLAPAALSALKRPSPAPTPARTPRPALPSAHQGEGAPPASRLALSRVSAADVLGRTRPHGPVLVGALVPRDVGRGRPSPGDARQLLSSSQSSPGDAQPRTVHALVAEMAAADAALRAAARDADYPPVPGAICPPLGSHCASPFGVSPVGSASPILSASPASSYSFASPALSAATYARHSPSAGGHSTTAPIITPDAEEILLALADRTLLSLCRAACESAAHRRRPGLALRDVEAALSAPGCPSEVACVGAALGAPVAVSCVRSAASRRAGAPSASLSAGGNPHASRMQQLRKHLASTGQL